MVTSGAPKACKIEVTRISLHLFLRYVNYPIMVTSLASGRMIESCVFKYTNTKCFTVNPIQNLTDELPQHGITISSKTKNIPFRRSYSFE